MRRIVDWPFFLAALILTGLWCAVLVEHVDGVFGWIVFAASLIPVYATIYQAVMCAKAALLHRRWTPALNPANPEAGEPPGVAFLIASYQEPFEVARMTFNCARDIDYAGPREIIVVDNSRDVASEDYKRWKQYVESNIGSDPRVRVVFRYNENGTGLKPGNIDLAQTLIEDAKYVVLLDVDSSLPTRSHLLERSVNEFEHDDKLGVVQFHTVATNDHFDFLTGPVAVAQNALRIQSLIRADGGFALFYGHNAMWRRSLLEQSGRWLEHYRGNVMVTEDLLHSVRAYTRGYTSRYVDVATGEWIPSSLDALTSMYMRWAYGGFQVLFKYFRQIITTRGLAPLERIDLLTFLASYAASPLVYPISVLWFLVFPPGRVGALTFVMIFVPPLINAWIVHRRYTRELNTSAVKKLWDLYAGFFMIAGAFIQAVGLRAVFNFLVGAKQGWRVTSKGLEQRPGWAQVIAHNAYVIGLATVTLAALIAAWGWRTDFAAASVVYYLPPAFISVNLLLCVMIYGRQGRNAEALIEGTTIDGYNFRNSVLHQVPLFHGTNALFQHSLALKLEPRTLPAGATIVEQGEPGREMFFVAHGEVDVSDGQRHLRTLGDGDFFGERSLLVEEPRSATVRARTPCTLFVLDKSDFLRVLEDQPKVTHAVAAQARAQYQLELSSVLHHPPIRPTAALAHQPPGHS